MVFRRVACACALAVLLAACGSEEPSSSTGDAEVTTTVASSSSANGPNTTELISVPVDSLGTEHVTPPVEYPQSPGIGGDHFGFWQNCGFYELPAIEGAAVHTLEHGAVWITYNADALTDTELDELRGLADANEKLLITPYDQSESLVLTAWGTQLRSDYRPSDPEVAEFIDTWVDNPVLAEAGVTCQDAAGIPPNDVRTLGDGSTVPDEFQ